MARKSPESKPMTHLWDLTVLFLLVPRAVSSSLQDPLDLLAFYL